MGKIVNILSLKLYIMYKWILNTIWHELHKAENNTPHSICCKSNLINCATVYNCGGWCGQLVVQLVFYFLTPFFIIIFQCRLVYVYALRCIFIHRVGVSRWYSKDYFRMSQYLLMDYWKTNQHHCSEIGQSFSEGYAKAHQILFA